MADGLKLETYSDRLRWQGFDEERDGPFFFSFLSEEQKRHFFTWFDETQERQLIGETSVSAIGMLLGLILGNRLTRIVQCGHYAGYSLMMLGMILKNINKNIRIASIDIDQSVTRFTNEWVDRSEISDVARTFVMDSSDPFAAKSAINFLGGAPELIFIDSSHQYRHTIDELNLWSKIVVPGGYICMHDASPYAAYQDHNSLGGVNRALIEWKEQHPTVSSLILQSTLDVSSPYKDPCGFGVMQILESNNDRSFESSTTKKMIQDPTLKHSDQWLVSDGWKFEDSGVSKKPGASSSINCFSPVVENEKYKITVVLDGVVSGGVHPAAGAGPLGVYFNSNGVNIGEITAGGGNPMIGLLATGDFEGTVLSFDAEQI